MNIKAPEAHLQIPVISDGKIINDALNSIGTNEKDIADILGNQGLSHRQIFLMTMNRKGEMNIIKKSDVK